MTGIIQLSSYFFHNYWLFSMFDDESSPMMFSIVRNLGIIFMLLVYYFSESMIRNTPNPFRLSLLSTALFGYLISGIYFINTGHLIRTNEIMPFAQATKWDEFCYDIIFLTGLLILFYNFYKQFEQSVEGIFKKNLLFLLIGIGVFLLTYLVEIMEHFLPIPDVDFVIFSVPMFLIIGYVYISNPNFIFYTPIDISLLQISSIDGHLIYSQEFVSEVSSKEYLISIGLSGVNSILEEIVDPETQGLTIRSIDFVGGTLIFEQIGELVAVVQADRETLTLRKSIHYLIEEFYKEYGRSITAVEGGVTHNEFHDIEALILRCIPIIQSKLVRET